MEKREKEWKPGDTCVLVVNNQKRYEAQLAEREVQEAGSRIEGDQPGFGQTM